MPFKLTAGQKALHLVNGEVFGPKQVVMVSPALARRARYIGEGAWLDHQGKPLTEGDRKTQGFTYIVFLDPETQQKFVQLQPQ